MPRAINQQEDRIDNKIDNLAEDVRMLIVEVRALQESLRIFKINFQQTNMLRRA